MRKIKIAVALVVWLTGLLLFVCGGGIFLVLCLFLCPVTDVSQAYFWTKFALSAVAAGIGYVLLSRSETILSSL